MKCIKETVRLLKEQGRLVWVVWDLSLMVGVLLASFIFEVGILAGFSFTFIVMVCWELSDVYFIKERNKLEEELADTTDKLILSEREAESLKTELEAVKEELETVKEAFKEGEKRWGQAAQKAKETVNQTEDTPSVTEQKPKPKRPAFKRKPKPKTENPDENKN